MSQNVLPTIHEISRANTQSIVRTIAWGFLIAYLVFPFLIDSLRSPFELMSHAESERALQRVFGFDASFVKLILTSDTVATGEVDAKMVLSKLSEVGFSLPESELVIDSSQKSFMIKVARPVRRSSY